MEKVVDIEQTPLVDKRMRSIHVGSEEAHKGCHGRS
jgi:hypothetical protein